MQQGVPGTITNTYTDTYRMRRVVSTELTDTVTDGAVEEVVEYGTRVSSVERSDRLVSVHSNGDGPALLPFASGDNHDLLPDAGVQRHRLFHRHPDGFRPPHGGRQYCGGYIRVPLWHADVRSDGEGLLALRNGHGCRLRHGHQGQQDRPLVQDLFRGMRWGRRDCTVYVLD